MAAGATLIGVNQRDLVTFEVDTDRAERVARMLPSGVIRVAESGIRDGDDVRRLADAGFDAVLVGEALVTVGRPRCRRCRALRAGPAARAGPLMFVKICGTTSRGRRPAGGGHGRRRGRVRVRPSPRQIAPQIAGDIVKRLPPEIVTVGVFRDESPERVLERRPPGRAAGRAAARPRAAADGPVARAPGCRW